MPKPRRITEMYLACVRQALEKRGVAVEIPRDFKTGFNAGITAACLREGYLRVDPRPGDTPIMVRGKRYIRTAGPVEADVREVGDIWRVTIKA